MRRVSLVWLLSVTVALSACTPDSTTPPSPPSTISPGPTTRPSSAPVEPAPTTRPPTSTVESAPTTQAPTSTVVTRPPTSSEPAAPVPAQQVPEVIEVLPHDPAAFTQGLLVSGDRLFESTGLFGLSTLREVDLETGEVLRSVTLPAELFGEGLALVGSRLIQLTWRNQVALVYDLETFEEVARFEYPTEGWGLCHDGTSLFMTDGTSTLYERDPVTFDLIDSTEVTAEGRPVARLNELECVGDDVYANIWQTDTIVAIDKHTGRVRALIDAGGLLTPAEKAALSPDAVLNGIAHLPDTDTFILTGKLWSKAFEVRLVDRQN